HLSKNIPEIQHYQPYLTTRPLSARPVACRAIFARPYRLWDRGFLLASSLGCLERIFRLGLMGIAGSRLTKLRRFLSSSLNSLSSRSLTQIAVTATINNIRTPTPTAKVKPWTSKIILENYTLKRALPARLALRKESCACCKELLPVGHEQTGDFGALAHIRGQPLLISGYRIIRRTSRTQLLR